MFAPHISKVELAKMLPDFDVEGQRDRMFFNQDSTHDEWWMMNDEWWMINDEWWMINDEW